MRLLSTNWKYSTLLLCTFCFHGSLLGFVSFSTSGVLLLGSSLCCIRVLFVFLIAGVTKTANWMFAFALSIWILSCFFPFASPCISNALYPRQFLLLFGTFIPCTERFFTRLSARSINCQLFFYFIFLSSQYRLPSFGSSSVHRGVFCFDNRWYRSC